MNGLVVFLGGGLGALVRYFLYLILPRISYFPLGTLVANFLGCFIATFVFTFLVYKTEVNSAYRFFLITGFCGGLSTLSAMSVELTVLIQNQEYLRASLYVVISLLICVISVILGLALVKKYV
jgi:CrcB protein